MRLGRRQQTELRDRICVPSGLSKSDFPLKVLQRQAESLHFFRRVGPLEFRLQTVPHYQGFSMAVFSNDENIFAGRTHPKIFSRFLIGEHTPIVAAFPFCDELRLFVGQPKYFFARIPIFFSRSRLSDGSSCGLALRICSRVSIQDKY